MKSKKLLFAVALTTMLVASSCEKPQETKAYGQYAYEQLNVLQDAYALRQAGTNTEKMAAEYVYGEYKDFGYTPEYQTFEYTRSSQTYTSQNVVAKLNNNVEGDKTLVIGAHYDSVSAGHGVDDNGSGTVALLEAAKQVAGRNDLPYDVVFVAFGAEEVGLKGSSAYVNSLTEAELGNIEVMVNLDTIAAGDYTYVYGGADEKSQSILKNLLTWSDEKELGLRTQQGLNEEYPAGTTGDWSDHAPFKNKGVPVLYCEATNWEIGPMDGSTQVKSDLVEEGYEIMHTSFDNLDFIEEKFPGRVEAHLSAYVEALVHIMETASL